MPWCRADTLASAAIPTCSECWLQLGAPEIYPQPNGSTLSQEVMLLLGTELCAPTPNSYVEALAPNVMVFGDGALGR